MPFERIDSEEPLVRYRRPVWLESAVIERLKTLGVATGVPEHDIIGAALAFLFAHIDAEDTRETLH